MKEDIILDTFPKESGVYMFKVKDEIIYVGSSKNLYKRMNNHKSYIRKGSDHGHKQDLYQFLQSNHFTVELQLTDAYRQLEQKLIEQYNPKYNCLRAYTGCGIWNGREAEYKKEYDKKYKEEKKQYYESHKEQILEQSKQYYESHKEEKKQYNNQLCYYNGQTLTLQALSTRFRRKGFDNPTEEAKKYLI